MGHGESLVNKYHQKKKKITKSAKKKKLYDLTYSIFISVVPSSDCYTADAEIHLRC